MAAPLFAGLPGMVVTAAVRTAPRLALRRPARMAIHARSPATRIDRRGNAIAELDDGALLHEGPTTIVTAGTCAAGGRGVDVFPEAERRSDRFQIKIAGLGVVGVLREMFAEARGNASSVAGGDDFLVGGIRIQMFDRVPAHTSGEVHWPDGRLSIVLAPERISILRRAR